MAVPASVYARSPGPHRSGNPDGRRPDRRRRHDAALVVDHDAYPWHDADFRAPDPADLIVYQFHVGVFHATDDGNDRRAKRVAKLLDAVQRVPYLAELGVNAVQPLRVVEFQGEWSLGYNGTDLFSPEMDYCLAPEELAPYLARVNTLLSTRGAAALTETDLAGQVNQLKAFAVLFDVVYNHAGGGLDPQGIDYIDLPAEPGPHNNAYFSPDGWAGVRVFAFGRDEVRRYLIDNALMFLERYHADGLVVAAGRPGAGLAALCAGRWPGRGGGHEPGVGTSNTLGSGGEPPD